MKCLLPLLCLLPVICPAAVKIVLVGDSTVNDQGGWGKGFSGSFNSEVQVINLALNGRSSKSFRDEGAWAPALTAKPDYVLILPWNIRDEIMAQLSYVSTWGGRFVQAVPSLRLL